jgi:hypothetical protein
MAFRRFGQLQGLSLRRVETRRYNIGRPYGTRRDGCSYGCSIEIFLFNGANATAASFIFYCLSHKKTTANATRDGKPS